MKYAQDEYWDTFTSSATRISLARDWSKYPCNIDSDKRKTHEYARDG